jgi:hypothetical protein
MRRINLGASIFGLAAAALVMTTGGDARSNVTPYGAIPPDQAEFISSADAIKSTALSGSPEALWQTLEHGEKVECLDCIPFVAPLLFDSSARTREIAAWWLRRRIFGVFGSGEVYQQTLTTLGTDANPTRRAYAAYALGEFLEGAGIKPLATALTTDADPGVRAAAASALGRINDDGMGALSKALGDGDATVRTASLLAAGRINSFVDTPSVAKLLGDSDANVRRQAVLLLDEMHAKDTVASVLALAQGDTSADVRIGACHALGTFGDSSAKSAVNNIAQNDSSSLVRDMANIALRNL